MIEVPDRNPPFLLNGKAIIDDDDRLVCVCENRETAIFVVRALNKAHPLVKGYVFQDEDAAKAFSERHIEPEFDHDH